MNQQADSSLWDCLPEELRWNRQWCIAGPDKSPYSVSNGVLYRADVTNPRQWLDFETACEVAEQHGAGIGYVLSSSCAYTCIDLDVVDAETQVAKGKPVDPTKWTTQKELDRYWKIVQAFDSYTEKSKSGKGLHIWVRGNIGEGCRRDGVEVYSQERFIICTGAAVIDKQVANKPELLATLVNEIRASQGAEKAKTTLVELDPVEPDEVIWQRAADAANGDKFRQLCEGNWQDMGYPSQSEADLALMSIFTFYSQSNEQCRRMFRMTGLGQREKARKNDKALNFMLTQIRGRQERDEKINAVIREQAAALVENMRAKQVETPGQLVQQMQAQMNAQLQGTNIPQAPLLPTADIAPVYVQEHQDAGLDWPPGMCGALAKFIYNASYRPVKEVSIITALGFLAGVCGKSFTIPGSGLNMYIILVARSAIGKEGMHSGISYILKAMQKRFPQAANFINFNDMASAPALYKTVVAQPCFLNVAGEFGQKLKRFSQDERAESASVQLRVAMTNLYQKSGPQSIVGGITYSNKDNNIAAVNGVSFSLIGETTPGVFYDSLTQSMMEDGFLSRFLVIEYDGRRPPANEHANTELDPRLADCIASLCQHSHMLISSQNHQAVGRDNRAADMLREFERECDNRINATFDESQRQMWNRAALKVARIAALLAVADNYIQPVMQQQHVEWALHVVRHDIERMSSKLGDGSVGFSDSSRERKVIALCKEYVTRGAPEWANVSPDLVKAGIIPRRYLQLKTNKITQFDSHKLGSTRALDQTIASLIDSGVLALVAGSELSMFKYSGKAYRLVRLDAEG